MYTHVPAEIAFPLGAKTTMAGLRDAIRVSLDVSLRRKREVESAFRSFEKATGRPINTISADPVNIRELLKDVIPAMAGVSAGTWRNVLSHIQFALGWAGLSKIPGRYTDTLTPEWEALISAATAPRDRLKLGRLGRYCGRHGIAPTGVNDTVMACFLNDLVTSSLTQEPARGHRDAIIAWNRCAARYQTWPQQRLAVPDNRNIYAVPWFSFPASLKAEYDAWIAQLAGVDLFAESNFEPLRPASLVTRKKQFHLWISALVLQGEDPATLCGMADLVTPERVAIGLHFFRDRAGGKRSLHAAQIVGVVRSIARHWVKLGQPELDRLKAMAGKITPKATGMTAKNKARLRPLYDRKTLVALMSLPYRLRAEVVRAGSPTRALALQMQVAVAIGILEMAPIRLKNLATLTLDGTLVRGRDGGLTVVLTEDDVKNDMPYEAELPALLVRLIDLYLKRYRPLLDGDGTAWLFPGRDAAKPKSQDGLRQQLQDCIRKHCGLRFNPHLFRHTAAMVMLTNNSVAHGQVQRVLVHRTLATTMEYYSGMETRAAMQHYDGQILELIDDQFTSADDSGRGVPH